MFFGCGNDERYGQDFPLIKIEEPDTSGYCYVIWGDNYKQTQTAVLMSALRVRLRTDKLKYTSIKFGKQGYVWRSESIIILVPNQEDKIVWQKWIDSFKLKSQRVLPPD